MVKKSPIRPARIQRMASPIEKLLPLLARLSEVDGDFKSLADLAAEDGRSPFHLQRLFRAEVGESPLQFSRRVRLQRAAASLLVTQKTVLEVALDAGFDSHEGFSRAFRARFGIAPRKFREERGAFTELVRHFREHLETANRIAPCVGLYRVSVQEEPRATTVGGSVLSYEVKKRRDTETPFLFMRRQVKPEAIAEALGAMFGPVFQYATAQGIPFAGRPTARYISFGPGLITIEAGMPVAGPADGEGEIEVGSLPGGDVATTIHKGPYDKLNQGHEAIQEWIAKNNEEADGAPWEVYITDPGEVPDPAEWQTEICWPLKGE